MSEALPYYSCLTGRSEDKTDKGRQAFARKWLLDVIQLRGDKHTLKNFRMEHEDGKSTVYFYLKEKRKKK